MSYEDIKKGLDNYNKDIENRMMDYKLRTLCRLEKRSLEYGSCSHYCCRKCMDRHFCEFICQYVFDKECEYERINR